MHSDIGYANSQSWTICVMSVKINYTYWVKHPFFQPNNLKIGVSRFFSQLHYIFNNDHLVVRKTLKDWSNRHLTDRVYSYPDILRVSFAIWTWAVYQTYGYNLRICLILVRILMFSHSIHVIIFYLRQHTPSVLCLLEWAWRHLRACEWLSNYRSQPVRWIRR